MPDGKGLRLFNIREAERSVDHQMKQYRTLVIELRKMEKKNRNKEDNISVSSVLRPKDETSPVRNSERKTRL